MTKEMAANGGQGLEQGGGTLSPPPQRATGACRPWGGRQAPLFFFLQGLRCKFEEKKLYLSPVAPPIGRPGYIFEIFQKRHIFLKFFFLNIKKKKPPAAVRPFLVRRSLAAGKGPPLASV